MSEIVATLPQGTQVVVEAKLLTSDVDHTIEEVRQEVQQQQNGITCGGAVSRGSNRTLFCRKCEGHGQQVVLKGHASRCPYNNCQCKTCSNVMSMRANAIIRRYRTRTLEGGLVLKPVHFKNGNTRLRVFPKYVDESDALPIPIGQQQHQLIREKNPSGESNGDGMSKAHGIPQTPPASLNISQPPYPVKRSFSEELEISRQLSPVQQNSIEQSPIDLPGNGLRMDNVNLSLLDMFLRQQGLNTDLLANGLLPLVSQPLSTMPSTLYDSSLLNGLSLSQTAVTYSSPTTYANSFISSNAFFPQTESLDRKVSDSALICPAAAQLSELNIGVTNISPVHSTADMAPKLTPHMFEAACTMTVEAEAQETMEPEPFTPNLMIAPTADRSHPLFKKFLNTVRELEKQMLVDLDS